MTDQKLPADWAIEWAIKEADYSYNVDNVKRASYERYKELRDAEG